MTECSNHKRMLLDIVNRDYINCKKTIIQDGKQYDKIPLNGNEPASDGRVKLYLEPNNTIGKLSLIIEQDHCLYINEFKSSYMCPVGHFDSFLKENFTIHDDSQSLVLFNDYIDKLSFFIPDFAKFKNNNTNVSYSSKLNNIEFFIQMWTVRKFISASAIQMEYNIALSLKAGNGNDIYTDYSDCVLGVSIENGRITEDFENPDKPLSYYSIDDLVYKTFFTLHPHLDTFENNTGKSIFTKDIYKSMIEINEMSNI